MNQSPLLKLTIWRYWQELDAEVAEKKIPSCVADTLKAVICSHQSHTAPLSTTTYIANQMKKYILGGIELRGIEGDSVFDVMVFVPNTNNEKARGVFFKLIPKYPRGQFKYLKDFQS